MARRTISSALGAAKAVLTIQALTVIGAASASVLIGVQHSSIKVRLTALVYSFHTCSGWRRCRPATENQPAKGEVALLFRFAMSVGIRIPQAICIGQTAHTINVIIAGSIAPASKTNSFVTAETYTALIILRATTTLSRSVCTARSGARRYSVVAKLTGPRTSLSCGAILAVIESTVSGSRRSRNAGNRSCDHGNRNSDHRNRNDHRKARASLGRVGATRIVAGNSCEVARSARPHAPRSGSARCARQVVTRRHRSKKCRRRWYRGNYYRSKCTRLRRNWDRLREDYRFGLLVFLALFSDFACHHCGCSENRNRNRHQGNNGSRGQYRLQNNRAANNWTRL